MWGLFARVVRVGRLLIKGLLFVASKWFMAKRLRLRRLRLRLQSVIYRWGRPLSFECVWPFLFYCGLWLPPLQEAGSGSGSAIRFVPGSKAHYANGCGTQILSHTRTNRSNTPTHIRIVCCPCGGQAEIKINWLSSHVAFCILSARTNRTRLSRAARKLAKRFNPVYYLIISLMPTP